MIKVGIVGTGWVAESHIAALKKIEGVSIRAIAGRNTSRGRELTAGTGAEVYENWRRMLEHEQLDAVFILLPPHLHGDLEIACAKYVRGVLVEKPVCADMKIAEKVAQAFKEAGTITCAGYQNRYRQGLHKAREALSAADDPIVLANAWWVSPMPGPLWWRTLEQSGGQFVEQCTHFVDAVRFLAGEITDVSAFTTRGFIRDAANFSIDDAMVVNVRFASGAIGNFTTACHPRNFAEVGMEVSSRRTHCTLRGWDWDLTIDSEGASRSQLKFSEDVFLIQNKAFIEAVRNNAPSGILTNYQDAVRTLAVTLAANESARKGHAVRISYGS